MRLDVGKLFVKVASYTPATMPYLNIVSDHETGWKMISYRDHNWVTLHHLFPVYPRCLNHCTYCKTKHARGDLGSYPPAEIVTRATQAFQGKTSLHDILTCLILTSSDIPHPQTFHTLTLPHPHTSTPSHALPHPHTSTPSHFHTLRHIPHPHTSTPSHFHILTLPHPQTFHTLTLPHPHTFHTLTPSTPSHLPPLLTSTEGVVEIWVTSEDLGAYGHDIGVTLPELLWQLVGVVPEGCMLRLGMTNPPYIMEHLEVCVVCGVWCVCSVCVCARMCVCTCMNGSLELTPPHFLPSSAGDGRNTFPPAGLLLSPPSRPVWFRHSAGRHEERVHSRRLQTCGRLPQETVGVTSCGKYRSRCSVGLFCS